MLSSRQLYFMVHGIRPARRSPRRRSALHTTGPVRSESYKAWIRTQPSMISGLEVEIEAAHTGSDGGMRLKASDTTCVPLTIEEHREYHRIGRDAMEEKYGVSFADAVRRYNQQYEEVQ